MDTASAAIAMSALISLFPMDVRLTYPEWKYKALTFSYDDAGLADRRLVAIFNKYGMRGTFNVSSNRLGYGNFLPEAELRKLYENHEIASHGKNHKNMPTLPLKDQHKEIADDLSALSRIAGYPVRGFAYPYAKTSAAVIDNLQKNEVYYARICNATGDFRLPEDYMQWRPTAKHTQNIDEIAEKYKDYKPWGGVISLCYIWGHSYEFDRDNNWDVIENFCKKLSNHPDIWYVTNLEFYRYLTAYRNLVSSMDNSKLYNNSAETLYFTVHGVKVKLAPGETMLWGKDNQPVIIPAAKAAVPEPVTAVADKLIFYPDGSRKALAFNYDDGQPTDERLAQLLSKYNCKATFNISSNILAKNPEKLAWYNGHEIATHGLRHATATLTTKEQIVNDIVVDRKVLETIGSRIVNGHAWPNGSRFGAPDYAQEALATAGIVYARGTNSHNTFALPENFMCWEPTAKAVPAALPELAKRFAAESSDGELKLCTVWGHSWEYKQESDWQALEEFCKSLSKEKVWRASFGEIHKYLAAVNALEWADRNSMVRNKSGEIIYIGKDNAIYPLKPGEVITFKKTENLQSK